MKSLIYKILKEDMGMKMSKVQSFQPKNYLVGSMKEKEKLLSPDKLILEQINELYFKIIYGLTNLSWEEIILKSSGSRNYVVKLPKEIEINFNLLKRLVKKLKYIDESYVKVEITNLLDDYNYSFIQDDVELEVDSRYGINRTHFPGGLPNTFKGFNLGFKIYRKLVDKVNFISSSSDASLEVQNIYRKLIESTDLNCIIEQETVMIIKKDLPTEKKKHIFDYFTDYLYETTIGYLKKPFILNKDIILDTPFIKELGVSQIKRILEDNFKHYKI